MISFFQMWAGDSQSVEIMSAVRKRSYSDGGEKGAGGDGGDTYVSYCNQFSLLLQTINGLVI